MLALFLLLKLKAFSIAVADLIFVLESKCAYLSVVLELECPNQSCISFKDIPFNSFTQEYHFYTIISFSYFIPYHTKVCIYIISLSAYKYYLLIIGR